MLYHVGGGVVGGAELQTAYLVNNLPDDVSALVTYESTAMEKFIFKNFRNKNFHRIFSPNDLGKKMQSFKPDIIQFYHSPRFYEYLIRIGTSAKVVEVAHNKSSFPWDCSTYGKEITDLLVFVSPDAEAHYLSKRGKNVATAMIPNGVDTDIFCPTPYKEKRTRLLGGFCGRLEGGDGKGVESVIKVARQMPIDLELVGYDFGNYRQTTKDMSNIHVIGHTSDIASYYKKWDFFISCSPAEGFGLAIAEALACGLPCVILDCGGITHYLKHKEHAYIAKDLEDVKRGVQEILDGATYNPTGVDFSARTMAKSYMGIYGDLLKKGRDCHLPPVISEPVKASPNTDHILGIVPEGWQGIRKALEARTTSICTPEKAINIAQKTRPGTIIFGGFSPRWFPVARSLKSITGARIIITYHGTAMMDEFDPDIRDSLIHAISAVKQGYADVLSFPHEGMARAMNQLYKVQSIFEPNILTPIEMPKVEKLKGLHVGLFGTGMAWKNFDTQLLAAAITPGLTTLHVQNLKYPALPNMLGISYKTHPYYSDRKDFFKLAASMTVNLAVTITECYGYFALESFMLGVPAIVGSTTPSMRQAQGALRKCIVNYIDDPAAISDAILEVLDDYDNVVEEGIRFVKRLSNM